MKIVQVLTLAVATGNSNSFTRLFDKLADLCDENGVRAWDQHFHIDVGVLVGGMRNLEFDYDMEGVNCG